MHSRHLYGRFVMADEKYDLILMEGTGFHRPFCRFIEARYIHVPLDPAGGVQLVCLEHGA